MPRGSSPIWQRDAPARVGTFDVAQDVLAHQLGGAVRVGGRERRVLADRQPLGLAVHGRARAEHEHARVVAVHRLRDVDEPAEIVRVVGERLGRALAHRLEGGEVHRGVDAVLREDGVERGRVAHVDPLEHRRLARQAGQPVQHLGRAVREVVDADDAEARGPQREPGMRGDVAGGPGEQDGGGGHHRRTNCAEQPYRSRRRRSCRGCRARSARSR